ncbi:MAG: hypothetical protein JWN34_6068 [Bryobacterales bacterium]|nr:hypothetical protein [Bryobacterales bacterium]
MIPYEDQDLAAYRDRFANLNRFAEPEIRPSAASAPSKPDPKPSHPVRASRVGKTKRVIRKRDRSTCDHNVDGVPCWKKAGMHKGSQRHECAACGAKRVFTEGGSERTLGRPAKSRSN